MRYYELREGKSYQAECGDVNFDIYYDLLVAGLGSAGSYLALSAAREGISVLGIERGTCCGGMSTQGGINGYYNGLPGGSFEGDDTSTAEISKKLYTVYYNHSDSKKLRIENSLRKYGVVIEYRSVVLGVYAEDDTVCGAKLLLGSKIVTCGCKYLSDSTSDGHILRIMGIKSTYGRPTDGATAPFSSVRVLRVGNCLTRTNHDSGYINPYNDEAFSSACIHAHAKHLDETKTGSGRFLYVAPLIGNREGITFEGEQTLTLADILEEKEWNDTLFCAFSDIDKHGADHAFDGRLFKEWFVISNLSTVTFKIRVPVGVIIPKGKKGIISVSRCLSIDSYASSAVRMNRDMYRLGESAGVAVALSVKSNTASLLDISFDKLRKRTEELGCFDSEPEKTKGFVVRDRTNPFVPVEWLTDFNQIKSCLMTDCPGTSIWSCKILGDKITDNLIEWLESSNENLRFNSAIALGLTGNRISLPVLREIVRKRSAYHFLDCRRSNQMRSVAAICLLGDFADTDIIDELESILQPKEYSKKMYHTYLAPDYKLSITEGLNSVYYQHFSFAVSALINIAKYNPGEKERIHNILNTAIENGSFISRITNQESGGIYYKLAEDIAEKIRSF